MNRVRCPICDRLMDRQGPKEWPDWPFCGPRCKLIDLGRWLSESYRLGAEGEAQESSDQAASDAEGQGEDDADSSPKSAVPSAVRHREEA